MPKRYLLLLIIGALLTGLLGACHRLDANVPRVTANQETLIGVYEPGSGQVASFRGIPYALPPVAEHRWTAPQRPIARSGDQLAQSFASPCYQDNGNTEWYRRVGAAFGVAADQFQDPQPSEDCLYLNVWTPDLKPNASLPVMVWIHGGSNLNGWSFEPNYQGAQLARRGQLVVVSIAYRLNVFGFFSHPDLAQSQAPANFGLLDQIAALHWVQDNIRHFGGDPANVTVFGESAGGADIGYLLNSPLSQGLFKRAISQSGGYLLLSKDTVQTLSERGAQLSQALPQNPHLEVLRYVSADTLYATAKALPGGLATEPVSDGISLKDPPAANLHSHGVPVDLLIGSNQNEHFMYADDSIEGLHQDLMDLPAQARVILTTPTLQQATVRLSKDRLSSLINMQCPPYLLAEGASANGHQAWVYRFTRQRPGPGGAALLVYHGAEIPYVFDTHDSWLPTEDADRALTQTMQSYWINFARTGNPNGPGLAPWPVYDTRTPAVMELGDHTGSIPPPDFALCHKVAPFLYPG